MPVVPEYQDRIRTCLFCGFLDRPSAGGGCLCTASCRDISEHAHSGECPMGLFADAQKRKRFTRTARARAMEAMLAEAVKLFPPYPAEQFSGRGIVTWCREDSFAAAYGTIRRLRDSGHDDPIQLWYLPPLWPWMREAIGGVPGVALIDASVVAKERPAALRAFAAIHSSFADVAFADPGSVDPVLFADKRAVWPMLQETLWRAEHGLTPEPTMPATSPHPDLLRLKSKHVVVVRLESNGDVLMLLPAMKHLSLDRIVSFATYERYVLLVRDIQWLKIIPIKEPMSRVQSVRMLKHAGEVRDVQPATTGKRRLYYPWDRMCWHESGVHDDLFDLLPLELENRDFRAERELIRTHHKHPERPLILLNLMAFTSPFPQGDRLRYLLMSWYGSDCEIIDLAFVRAKRMIDLAGLYERATCLISCDTGTLHLGYATGTPTIALVSDGQGRRSPGASTRRPHWICRLLYGRALTERGIRMIRERIDGLLYLPKRRKLEIRGGTTEKMTHATA